MYKINYMMSYDGNHENLRHFHTAAQDNNNINNNMISTQKTKLFSKTIDLDLPIIFMASSVLFGILVTTSPYLIRATINYSANLAFNIIGTVVSSGWTFLREKQKQKYLIAERKKNDDLETVVEHYVVDKHETKDREDEEDLTEIHLLICTCNDVLLPHPLYIPCAKCTRGREEEDGKILVEELPCSISESSGSSMEIPRIEEDLKDFVLEAATDFQRQIEQNESEISSHYSFCSDDSQWEWEDIIEI